uniref:Gamma-soluble NSF attachment protein n=1 Tax=Ditylenchus dipsaci TaxID=166011 RepID=A0A915DBY3_9BILA
MTANERRIKEANECIQKAEEHLKTSIWKMKTKPNYDSAAYEYERAAVCWRNAERLDFCKDAYLDAAKCHASNNNLFHEAKSRESAGMAAKDAKDYHKAAELFELSASGYFNTGSVDTAAQTLDKAAKIMLENQENECAAKLYEKGLEIVQHSSDKSKMATNFAHRLINTYLKMADYVKAMDTSKNLIDRYNEIGEYGKIGQLVMGMTLIELIKGDSIAALKMLYYLPEAQISSFGQEMNAVKCLIKAYESYDNEALQNCLKSGMWRSMDNEYLRLMKQVKAPEGECEEVSRHTVDIQQQENEDEEDLR